MKILIITLEYPPQIGGIASYVYNVALHWKGESVVFAPKTAGDSAFDTANNIRIVRKKPYFILFWPRWIKMLWQIWHIVKSEKIEAIHVHHAIPSGYIAFVLNKLKKIPYTIFFHGADMNHCTKNWWKKMWLNVILKKAGQVVVNSEFMKNELKIKYELFPENKIKILYPCPCDNFFEPVYDVHELKSQLAIEGKKVIISVSRLVERKGHVLFINPLIKILQRVPNLVWLIIGDGPEKNALLALVLKHNLHNIVRFLPSLPLAELPKYYHVADLFLLLTHKDKEGVDEAWGTVFLEAGACGLPVVAGRSGGVEEAVENLVTGVVVDSHREDAVVSTVSDLLLNSEYSKKIGQAGRDRVSKNFTWDIQLEKLF